MSSNKNEVFEYLIDQLRQQVNSNQLRDASAQVAELQKELEHMGNEYRRAIDYALSDAPEQSGCRKEDVQECEHSWIIMPGLFLGEGNPNNVPGSELCSKCGKREWDDKVYKPKNDTQECEHDWVEFHGLFIAEGDPRNGPGYTFCRKCGVEAKQ